VRRRWSFHPISPIIPVMSDPAAAASSTPAPEPAAQVPPPTTEPIDYATPAPTTARERFSLLRAGGALGVAAFTVSVILFVLACFGFDRAFRLFPFVPLIASIGGVLLTITGGLRRAPQDEDTHVLFGLFVNAMAVFSALLEIMVGHK
jgi:hypothetical protein